MIEEVLWLILYVNSCYNNKECRIQKNRIPSLRALTKAPSMTYPATRRRCEVATHNRFTVLRPTNQDSPIRASLPRASCSKPFPKPTCKRRTANWSSKGTRKYKYWRTAWRVSKTMKKTYSFKWEPC